MGRGRHTHASARTIEVARRKLEAKGIPVTSVYSRPDEPEPVPCLVCGRKVKGKLICGNCRNDGWRDKECPSCGKHQLHARDYDSGPYRTDRILKCGWCRRNDRPDSLTEWE